MISSGSAPQVLPGVLSDLAPVLNQYGYLAVGGFVFLEDFGVPLPGETILIAAAVYAGAGKLDIALVVLIAIVAAVLGDNIGYLIGHVGGRRLIVRWGRYVLLTEQRLAKAEQFFGRHGGKVVTVARFIEGLRQANGIIAGISRMHWLRFGLFNLLGAVLWVGVWASVGYTAGSNIDAVYDTVHDYAIYAGIVLATIVVVLIVRAVLRHRHKHRPADR